MWIGYEGLGTSTVSPFSRQASIRCARPSFEPMVTIASESGSNSTPQRPRDPSQTPRGLDQLVDDVLRRRPVGVAHRQVDDVLAVAPRPHLQLVGDVEDVRRQALNP